MAGSGLAVSPECSGVSVAGDQTQALYTCMPREGSTTELPAPPRVVCVPQDWGKISWPLPGTLESVPEACFSWWTSQALLEGTGRMACASPLGTELEVSVSSSPQWNWGPCFQSVESMPERLRTQDVVRKGGHQGLRLRQVQLAHPM